MVTPQETAEWMAAHGRKRVYPHGVTDYVVGEGRRFALTYIEGHNKLLLMFNDDVVLEAIHLENIHAISHLEVFTTMLRIL